MSIKIGSKIRNLRKQGNITLSELSASTDLSVGFLSNLERDLSSPTLDSLQKICSVLKIALLDLLGDNQYDDMIIKQDKRKQVFMQENNVCYEYMNFGPDCLDGLVLSIAPNYQFDRQWTHVYDEIGLVLEGTMTVIVDDMKYEVHQGDCCYIKAKTKHGLSNNTSEECKSFWVKQNIQRGF